MQPFKRFAMNDITQQFGTLYHPVKAFVVYRKQSEQDIYVEAYDMDARGFPINAHPLSVRESTALAKALDCNEDLKRSFLKPSGLLPKNVLYLNSGAKGFALWHTPAMQVNLLFREDLTIPCGHASVPPLLWVASKESLHIYALAKDEQPDEQTPLCHAPSSMSMKTAGYAWAMSVSASHPNAGWKNLCSYGKDTFGTAISATSLVATSR